MSWREVGQLCLVSLLAGLVMQDISQKAVTAAASDLLPGRLAEAEERLADATSCLWSGMRARLASSESCQAGLMQALFAPSCWLPTRGCCPGLGRPGASMPQQDVHSCPNQIWDRGQIGAFQLPRLLP